MSTEEARTAEPLTPEEEAEVRRRPRGWSLVCSIDKHDRCNGYAPAAYMTPCNCGCHGIHQADRWLATLDAARSLPVTERERELDDALRVALDRLADVASDDEDREFVREAQRLLSRGPR